MIVLGYALALLIGLSLGMLGGGGSILTVPTFVYVLGYGALRIGPIPQGTPINLLANTDLELSAANAPRLVKLALALNAALRDIKARGLTGAAATGRLQDLVPDLLAVSKCPDFIADRGHPFGTRLSDDDKHALIAFLKRL